jgi:hypothetical protein
MDGNVSKQVSGIISKYKDQVSKKFEYIMDKVLNEEFKSDFISIFSDIYDSQFADLSSRMSKMGDPTSPAAIKSDVMEYISSSFDSGVSFTNGEVKLSIINPNDLGYPKGPSKYSVDKVKMFYFYLEGVIGDFAFISNKTYDIFNPSRKGASIGRFGKGFLIDMKVYSKRRKSVKDLPSEEEVRFPASGLPPSNIFDMVMSKIDFRKYVNIAYQKMVEEVK